MGPDQIVNLSWNIALDASSDKSSLPFMAPCQLWTALTLESVCLLICLIKLKFATCPPKVLVPLGIYIEFFYPLCCGFLEKQDPSHSQGFFF